MQKLVVGVIVGHGERIVPTSQEYTRFFERLAASHIECRVIQSPKGYDELADCSAILVGSPRKALSSETIEAIQTALSWGHRVMLVGYACGDAQSIELGTEGTNLNEIHSSVQFNPDLLYYFTELEGQENMVLTGDVELPGRNTRVQVDLAACCTLVNPPKDDTSQTIVLCHSQNAQRAKHVRLSYDNVLTANLASVSSVENPVFLLHKTFTRGSLTALSGSLVLSDHYYEQNKEFIVWLIDTWIPSHQHADFAELQRRMNQVQRHRLLHGYPMLPMMKKSATTNWYRAKSATTKPKLVGVLPHSFCNPTVKGCGFCTFPQEKFNHVTMEQVTTKVIEQLRKFGEGQPRRSTPAIYLGGATANLTPPQLFHELCQQLAKTFDLGNGEITLEGVPSYFMLHEYGLMKMLRRTFPEARKRISMGIQTLDPIRLAAMGRSHFGGTDEFEEVVNTAHSMGFSTSADLLINIPGQSLDDMLSDVDGLVSMGFDQICVYHLVLVDDLDVPWAKNKSIMKKLPENSVACERFLRVRDRLLELGFSQRTLTNFHRESSGFQRFAYEELGFTPEEYDLVGFGPSAISLQVSKDWRSGIKTVEHTDSGEFLSNTDLREFVYHERDLQILFITRGVAKLFVDGERFRYYFGRTISDIFPYELEALVWQRLVEITENGGLKVTNKGNFYADSIAGLFAWKQVNHHQENVLRKVVSGWRGSAATFLRFQDPNASAYGGMG